jgi:DNA-binding MarR family transcriptional regulator
MYFDIKFLLLEKLSFIEDLSRSFAKSYGYEDNDILSSSAILTYVDHGVTTISAIAKKLGISRQAVHKSVQALAKKGYLFLQEGEDKRERVICMTDDGQGLLKCRQEVMAKVEGIIEENIGKNELKELKKLLSLKW